MRFHHIFGIVGGTALCLSSTGGSTFVSKIYSVCVIVALLSNPFQKMRFILKARNEENTLLYKKIDEAHNIIFIFNRLILATFVNYNMWVSKFSIVIKLSTSGVYYIGIYWVFVTMSQIAKKMKEKHEKPKGRIELFLRVVGWISRNTGICLALTLIWSFGLPYIATQHMEASYTNIRVANFIIV
jgi:hypothetical protein